MQPVLYLITGVMASGKSTIAELLASKLEKGVHLRGDVFRRMIVSGREDMSADPTDEARRQLDLRYRLAANAAKTYYDGGFSVVLQDNYYGDALTYMLEQLKEYPVRVIVLCPNIETIQTRERTRGKAGYTGFSIEDLYRSFMTETPKIGFWLDNSEQTAEQSAQCIAAHFQ